VEAIYGTQLQRVALNHRISVFGSFPVTQDQKGRTIEGEIAPAAQVHIPILLPDVCPEIGENKIKQIHKNCHFTTLQWDAMGNRIITSG